MKKFYLFYVMLSALFFVTSCDKNELLEGGSGQERPILPSAHPSVLITGDGMIASRSSGDRVEFTGGYATGAGLYNGDGRATVEAVPYEGYSLASFTGGPIGGNPNQFNGANRYGFPIESQDWKFTVSFEEEGEYLIVGNDGYIAKYKNGIEYLKQVGTSTWRDIAYGNGMYVAVGDGGYVTHSKDGMTWATPKKLDTNGCNWNRVTYGNDMFVVVGDESYISTSTDGITWSCTIQPLVNNNNFHLKPENLSAVAYGNGRFKVTAATTDLLVSRDAITWEVSALSVFVDDGILGSVIRAYRIYDIVYGGDKWRALCHEGTKGGYYMVKTKEKEDSEPFREGFWSKAIRFDGHNEFRRIAYNPDKDNFVMVNRHYVISSVDKFWKYKTHRDEDGNSLFFNALVYSKGKYIGAGDINNKECAHVSVSSSTGHTWSICEIPGMKKAHGVCPIQ